MTYPVLYHVTYSYTGFQQAQGNNSFPGTQLDADLAGLEQSVDNLAAFVKGVARSDGALKNGVVTYDSLNPALQTAGIAPAVAWQAGAFFAQNAPVYANGSLYRATAPHTAGSSFATDLAAGKWLFISLLVVPKPHVVTYTVAPATATAADKALADFVGDGVNDQVAIQNAFAAAGASNSAVVALPGNFVFSDTCNIPGATNCYFYAEGAVFNGVGGTKDTFYSPSMIRCNYYFGTVNHSGTGSAIHVVQFANGSWLTAQSIHGAAHQGRGVFIDATTTGSSTGYIQLGWLDGFDKGIHFYSKTIIDTHVVWLNYGFNCNWVIYDETDVGASVQNNAMTWNVNLDTAWTGSAVGFSGIWTNGTAHVINGTIGSTVGGAYGPNVKLDTAHGFAAAGVQLNLTPLAFAHEAGNVVNNSGNIDHVMSVGMSVSLATGGYGNNLAKWSGGNIGQLDNTGISLSSIGTQYTIVYCSATGVLSSLATANNGVLVTNGAGAPSIATTLPNVTIPVLSGTTANVTNVNAATVNVNNVNVAGTTSGGVVIKSPAVAGANTLTLPAGTTDFSATGGTSRVVKQTSVGGAFTVAQLGVADISGFGTGVATALGNSTGAAGGLVTYSGAIGNPSIANGTNPIGGGVLGFNAGTLNYGDGANNHVFVSTDQVLTLTNKTLTAPVLTAYTVAALPAGSAGMMAWCSNCRVFNGAGAQEGAGVGTGGLVTHNGTAWKIAGTNITAVA